MMSLFDKCEDTGKLILRLAAGGLLLFHGVSKLQHGVDWMTPMLAGAGLPGFIRYGVYVGEVVAPILIIAGIFSRPAGLVMAFNLVMAVLLARRDAIGALNDSGAWAIELEMFYILAGLAIYCLGAGKFSVSRGKGKWD